MAEVMLNLCRRHHTIAVVVDTYMHDVTLSTLHPLLLLTERAEKVFHQSPIQECAEIIDPRHLKTHEIAHFCKRFQGGGNRALVLVEIYKHIKFIAHLTSFGHITRRQQYLSFHTSVEIHSEIHFLHYFQVVVVTKFYLVHDIIRYYFRPPLFFRPSCEWSGR